MGTTYPLMWSEAKELADIANQFQLPDLAKIIGEAMRNHRATSTFNQYARELRTFPEWLKTSRLHQIPISKARNLYLASILSQRKPNWLSLSVSALNLFLGKQVQADREVEKSML
ncbi:hypothetical protein ANCCAN_06948 [Ancylostoma caninum]|uniref:Core-binding (CB) domain-containing protein n=1 Tax=Ancylostoma caninum TaxID=29170 RepID=A0A368GVM6_ANCCA|nr:hypothetical protein ANCCAN_06948 [Ancylostoma caninum]